MSIKIDRFNKLCKLHLLIQTYIFSFTTIKLIGQNASLSKFFSPSTLASDNQGNIYVGDYKFIKKIDKDGNIFSLYELNDHEKVRQF